MKHKKDPVCDSTYIPFNNKQQSSVLTEVRGNAACRGAGGGGSGQKWGEGASGEASHVWLPAQLDVGYTSTFIL